MHMLMLGALVAHLWRNCGACTLPLPYIRDMYLQAGVNHLQHRDHIKAAITRVRCLLRDDGDGNNIQYGSFSDLFS